MKRSPARPRSPALPERPEPTKRSYLRASPAWKNGTQGLTFPPNSIAYTEGFNVLKENTLITNFQPHFHLRGKECRSRPSCSMAVPRWSAT
ncbi:MAG: hypothetical protein R2708_17445 [Vicinamibacterales bacterium]